MEIALWYVRIRLYNVGTSPGYISVIDVGMYEGIIQH